MKELFKTISPAIIGLIGVVIGSFLTSYNTNESTRLRIAEEQKISILNKRIELIERTKKITSKLVGINELFNYHFYENGILKDSIIIFKKPEMGERLSEYKAEFWTTMSLNKFYFGSKTVAELNKLFKDKNKNWWQMEESDFDPLFVAMFEELKTGLEEN